ncbi:unnamed protein product [Eruca vesicaria subsp. sativa]|uniref:Uncharacterized protein n=1 Tax=Eruca vesicaria subsp. sativa TaxID=29727 RepID=A0ABC8MAC8_ERUVS|nr:unnamed protein product [Eruca vesicaria subsp. sativa]
MISRGKDYSQEIFQLIDRDILEQDLMMKLATESLCRYFRHQEHRLHDNDSNQPEPGNAEEHKPSELELYGVVAFTAI